MSDRGTIVSDDQALKDGKSFVALWIDKIKAARDEEKDWRKVAGKAASVYEAGKAATSVFNIYHANVETIIPALYNSTPIPDVRQRYNDAKSTPPNQDAPSVIGDAHDGENMMQSPDARGFVGDALQDDAQLMGGDAPAPSFDNDSDISKITERALSFSVDDYLFDDVMEDCVRDNAVTGRGIVRVRYHADIDDDDEITNQRVSSELVPWNRFIRGPGLHWGQVPFIGFEHDMSMDDVKAIIGDDQKYRDLQDHLADADNEDDEDSEDKKNTHKGLLKTLKVYEVWDKNQRTVFYISPDFQDDVLARLPDPLKLKDFYPVPKPMQSVRRLTSVVPVCPYTIYEDLIQQLVKLSSRISALTDQVRVRGLYDPKLAPDFKLLATCSDGEYIECSDGGEFQGTNSGGLEKAVMHWPNEEIVRTLDALLNQREQVKQTIYETMGISDIMRGSVDFREKATQSQLKQESGSKRLQRSQAEVSRVARALFRLKAEIIHGHFEPHILQRITNIMPTAAHIEVMRSNAQYYTIDIETDSTIRADRSKFQGEMTAFLEGTAQFANALGSLAQIKPEIVSPMMEVYASFTRKFNLGRQGEDALDKIAEVVSGDDAGQLSQQQQADQQQEQAMQQKALEDQEALANAALQREQEKHQAAMALKDAELTIMREKASIEAESRAHQSNLRAHQLAQQHEATMELKAIDLAIAKEKAALDMAAKSEDMRNKALALELSNYAKQQQQQQQSNGVTTL